MGPPDFRPDLLCMYKRMNGPVLLNVKVEKSRSGS